jgi:uncharacterized protein YuzE
LTEETVVVAELRSVKTVVVQIRGDVDLEVEVVDEREDMREVNEATEVEIDTNAVIDVALMILLHHEAQLTMTASGEDLVHR